ncbi:hypothetical protein [Mycolicibacterium sp.]|uniref:hypothetical protein n=1 Tax=Mycolicibacterium sp. TaxID=2320850 RepID=UPI003D1207AF
MTELATGPSAAPRPGHGGRVIKADPTQGTTLITEEEVLLATTVALAPPVRRRRLREVLRTFFASPEKGDPPRRYPKHYDFIESARMSREMYRL